MSDTPELDAAAIASQAARARLLGTAHELQARLAPERLIDEAIEGAKSGAAGLAGSAERAARRRPGAAAAIGLALVTLIARKRIGRVARRIFRRRKRADDEFDY